MTSYVEIETEIHFEFDVKEILDAVMKQALLQEFCHMKHRLICL